MKGFRAINSSQLLPFVILVSTFVYSSVWGRTLEPSVLGGESIFTTVPPVAPAMSDGRFAVRFSVGTDINLGLGFGAGVAYMWLPSFSTTGYELGADLFYHKGSDSESKQVGQFMEDWEEHTQLIVFCVRANGLFNYAPRAGNIYFIVGVGFVIANIKWEEKTTFRGLVPGISQSPGGSDVEGTSVGNIVNLGVGGVLGKGFECRLETPMLYFYSAPGSAAAFAPTFTIGVTYRFR